MLIDRKIPRIGDVVEIETPNGLAYAQFTHKHEKYGALIRTFPTLHTTRPSSFNQVVLENPQIIIFFPLGAACKQGIVKIVANEPIPASARDFPLFRSGTPNLERKVETWWLWDGQREWKVGALEPGMEKLPIRGIWNDTLLIKRIAEGWSHESAQF